MSQEDFPRYEEKIVQRPVTPAVAETSSNRKEKKKPGKRGRKPKNNTEEDLFENGEEVGECCYNAREQQYYEQKKNSFVIQVSNGAKENGEKVLAQ